MQGGGYFQRLLSLHFKIFGFLHVFGKDTITAIRACFVPEIGGGGFRGGGLFYFQNFCLKTVVCRFYVVVLSTTLHGKWKYIKLSMQEVGQSCMQNVVHTSQLTNHSCGHTI